MLKDYNNKLLGYEFSKKFSFFIIDKTHFRNVLTREQYDRKPTYISEIVGNISGFITNCCLSNDVQDTFNDKIISICSEIIGNTFEHSDGDCLVDIKFQKNRESNIFLGINIISLTNTFIGKDIKTIIFNKQYKKCAGGKIIKKAFRKHKRYFSPTYTDDLFSFLCAFQQGVSSRMDRKESGGTGLTVTLQNIQSNISKNYNSYMLSGKNVVYFKNEFLVLNKKGLIGFNKEHSFFKKIPDSDIVLVEKYCFPGTIFSVNLII